MNDLVKRFFKQFGHPEGALGALALLTMAAENRRTNRRLVDLASVSPGDRALDVGCGPGIAVRYACRTPGVAVTGVDASPTAIAVARSLTQTRPGLRFEVATSESLPFADADFTVAWSMNSVHHWADRAGGLAQLHRVIEPGGRLVIGERRPAPDAGKWSPRGLTDEAVEGLVGQLAVAGFAAITTAEQTVGKDRFVAITASRA